MNDQDLTSVDQYLTSIKYCTSPPEFLHLVNTQFTPDSHTWSATPGLHLIALRDEPVPALHLLYTCFAPALHLLCT
jgi:hypothetical protein